MELGIFHCEAILFMTTDAWKAEWCQLSMSKSQIEISFCKAAKLLTVKRWELFIMNWVKMANQLDNNYKSQP